MNEEQSRLWLRNTFGSPAFDRLQCFVEILLGEAARQSLIARSSFAAIWSRHIADSAQLVTVAPRTGTWLDVGSGAGLPGMVVAILRPAPMILVEPRRKRAEFLIDTAERLKLTNVRVEQCRVEHMTVKAAVISARAVGSLPDLFSWTRHAVSRETVFVLPRGRKAMQDLTAARSAWTGEFHVKQSLTDDQAGIVIATGVTSA